MQETSQIWKNGKLIPWHEATTHVLTHSLHYGSGVFEGIRCYKTNRGPAVFHLDAHLERFLYSAKHIGMKLPYTKEDLIAATKETMSANSFTEGYIRPLAYYGYGSMVLLPVAPELELDVIIACWPWPAYMGAATVEAITSKYIRIHPRSTVADAKISGHYVNSILAQLELVGTKYKEALLLDADGYVAEGCTANVFVVKDGKMMTPPLGTILPGITRRAVMEIANYLGIEVTEKKFHVEDIYAADECFFTGTAVEVNPALSLDDHVIGRGDVGEITQKIKDKFLQVVHGEVPEFHNALTFVE